MKRLGLLAIGMFAIMGLGAANQLGTLVTIPGVAERGIFDPSIAATPPGQRAWMSYSAVNPSRRFPDRNTRVISTRLAYSDDAGATWNDAGSTINETKDVPIGSKAGTWVSEVSSLVFDPSAPPEERWKLFWHHYLHVNEEGQFQNGWIGLKSASAPMQLLTAREIKLFGARGYNADNNNPGGDNGSPVAGAPVIKVHEINSELGMCVALSEPAALATSSGLYLALTCYRPNVNNPIGLLGMALFGVSNTTILLRCDSKQGAPNPRAWSYLGTVLTVDDAKSAGFIAYSAPDLFAEGDGVYLIASPVTNRPGKNAYNGCRVFRFADLGTARLERENGLPRTIQEINGRPESFNGACTYQPTVTRSGFMYSQLEINNSRPYFRIFQTGVGLRNENN